jgi:putative oxidoreductase
MKRLNQILHLPCYQGWATAILRVVTGIVFLAHGYKKIFADGLSAFAGFLSQAGIPAPNFFAPVVAGLELVGGLALIAGLFTRWAAILLAIEMLAAAVTVHLRNGFFLPNGYEYALVLLAASVSLFLAGSGECAVDNIIWHREKPTISANPAVA